MPRCTTEAQTVEKVQARLEDWRRNRTGRAEIPDELWLAAAEVARRDGVNRTAAALHLDGGKLKRRMVAADSAFGKVKPRHLWSCCPYAPPASRNASSNWRVGVASCESVGPAPQRLIWLL